MVLLCAAFGTHKRTTEASTTSGLLYLTATVTMVCIAIANSYVLP